MELREYNYRAPQFLRKLRTLLKRDGALLHGAFQRSVILTRKGSPRQHAITRIDLYASPKQFQEEKKHYDQIRFISEHLSLEKLISRLRRLQKLRFTAGTTSVKFPNNPGFHNDYRPRNNEFSDWPGTLFDISLESVYLSSDLLSAPNLPTQETEYSAVGDF